MSILIKGMEMPKSCSDCPMLDWDLDYIKCKVTGRHFKVKEEPFGARRVNDCPLIELPPHGRLIDASELEREISRWIPHPDKYINKRNSDFLYYIKDTPTIIEADCPPSTPLEQVWTEVFGEDGE